MDNNNICKYTHAMYWSLIVQSFNAPVSRLVGFITFASIWRSRISLAFFWEQILLLCTPHSWVNLWVEHSDFVIHGGHCYNAEATHKCSSHIKEHSHGMTSFHFWYIFRLLVSNYVLIILQSTQRRSQAHKWCEKFVKNSQAHRTNLLACTERMLHGERMWCDIHITDVHTHLKAPEYKMNTTFASVRAQIKYWECWQRVLWTMKFVIYHTVRYISLDICISSQIRFKFLIMFLHFQAMKLSFPAPINLIESSTVLLKNCEAPPNMHGLLRLAAVCRPAPFSVEWLEYTNVPLHPFNICVCVCRRFCFVWQYLCNLTLY